MRVACVPFGCYFHLANVLEMTLRMAVLSKGERLVRDLLQEEVDALAEAEHLIQLLQPAFSQCRHT